jgi:hypothetical protein
MGLILSTGTKKHALDQRKDDLYETPSIATEALLSAIKLPHHIWEPACGPGAIVTVLRRAGHDVMASDLVSYGCPGSEAGVDFLMTYKPPFSREWAIVTNPPFKLATEFAIHALNLAPKVYMLLRLAFLESERRSEILDGGKLSKVMVFRRRLPMMHRDGWEGPRASSAMAFAWFCWDAAHNGPAELTRI